MRLFSINDDGELIKIDRLHFEENDVYLVDDEEKNTIYIWVGLEVPQSKKDITADIARRIDKERGGSVKMLIMKQKREYGSFLAMMHNLKKGFIPGKTIERRPEFVFKTPPERIKSVGLNGIPEEREINAETRILQWLKQIQAHRKIESPKKPEKLTDTVKFVKFKEPMVNLKVKSEIQKEKAPEPQLIKREPEIVPFKIQIREAAYYLSLKGYTYDELCWILAEKIQRINLKMPSIEDIRQKAEQVFNSSCTYDELCWLNAEMDILIENRFLQKNNKSFEY